MPENWKKLSDIKTAVIPALIRALRTILKNMKKSQGTKNLRKNWDHPDHSTAAEYLGESWKSVETYCPSEFNKKPQVKTDVKNSHEIKCLPILPTLVK